MVFLDQPSADEVVAGISVAQAKRTLVDALKRLPTLAGDLENGRTGPLRVFADRLARPGPPVWFLALDEIEPTGSELRLRLPGASAAPRAQALPPHAPSRCPSSSAP
jgi:5-methylthioadenosine/S-adenosylhomocysteine deaminase